MREGDNPQAEKGALLWITLECSRVLYVDRGRETILCDRIPSPVTLVIGQTPAQYELSRARKET